MITTVHKCFFIALLYIFSIFCLLSADCESIESEPKSRCYLELGCIEYDTAWYDKKYRPINDLPLARHTVNTQFLIYVRNNQTNIPLVSEMVSTLASMNISSYNKSLPVRFLIHDFTSSGYTGWIEHLALVLLEKKEIGGNVISVNWEAGAGPPYTQAIGNARLVALEILRFVAMLHNNYDLEHSKLHLIGHGVGAHIAGYVGDALKVDGQARVGKITALDPNGPYFEHMPIVVRLDKTDALFVEAIHTDAHPEGQGMTEAVGHTDFYPNNGYAQPGCDVSSKYPSITKLTRDQIKPGEIYPGCDHKRSFKYYIEAVRNTECTYLGIQCSNYSLFLKGGCTSCNFVNGSQCAQLGLDTPFNDSSYKDTCSTIYYFRTGAAKVFCLDAYKFTINFPSDAKSQCKVSGNLEVNLTSIGSETSLSLGNDPNMHLDINQCRANYIFLRWATPPPTLKNIGSAVMKWTSDTSLTMSKKISLFINKLTVTLLTKSANVVNELCSEKSGSFELESQAVACFHACGLPRSETCDKSAVNDSDSNLDWE